MSCAVVGREENSLHPDFMGLDQSLSTVKAPCRVTRNTSEKGMEKCSHYEEQLRL